MWNQGARFAPTCGVP
ncbi:hypothetical protein B4U79_04636, partial [Dinothrombium tinctorium]